jgi:general secretion pathway protein K
MSRTVNSRSGQRGAALLVAMLVLTLVGTLAAGMVWQQWRAIEVESAERRRAQGSWILTGAVDLGRVMLRLDGRTPGVDHLQEPWATPLTETSLSSLLSQDRENNVDGGPEAYLSGGIVDAQARYNLRNLVDPATRRIIEAELAALSRLCEAAGVAPEAAQTIANALRGAPAGQEAGDDTAAPAVITPQNVAQLRWLGLDADTVSRLQDYVTLLPEPTPLNLNTAQPAVIAAVIGLDLGSANRLKNRRPMRSLDAARADIPQAGALDPKRVGVNSKYFEIAGRLRMDGRIIEERLLVERKNRDIVALARSRQSLLPAAP